MITLLAFLGAISLLITFHEFGHFLIARLCGVKVLVFSIGFGKPLLTCHDKSGTRYQLAMLPLGGYVQFLDESNGILGSEEYLQSFPAQSLFKKFLIVAAGPVFNLIFSVLALMTALLIGMKTIVPVIGEITHQSPAEKAGLASGQTIIQLEGQAVPSWEKLLVNLITLPADKKMVSLTTQDAKGKKRDHQLVISGAMQSSDPLTYLGVEPYMPVVEPIIASVVPNSPAEEVGLQAGDKLLQINNKPINDWKVFTKYIRVHPNQVYQIKFKRGESINTVSVKAAVGESVLGNQTPRIGVQSMPIDWPPEMIYMQRESILSAISSSIVQTMKLVGLTLTLLMKSVLGQLSMAHLSGPVGIAVAAGQSASIGFTYYLQFLAMLSVSLAVLNLLPIPMLDGGHLFYYLIEAVRGRPLSKRAQEMGLRGGLIILLGMMVFTLYNDLNKLW